jgi:hypothetical protein
MSLAQSGGQGDDVSRSGQQAEHGEPASRGYTVAVEAAARRALALVSALTAACGGSSGGVDRVPGGSWGGEHVALRVHDTGADVDLDCAHGAITVPLHLETDGSFRLPGYFVADVGPSFDPEIRRPATYFGDYDGQRLLLSLALDEGGGRGPFTAVLGGTAVVAECR